VTSRITALGCSQMACVAFALVVAAFVQHASAESPPEANLRIHRSAITGLASFVAADRGNRTEVESEDGQSPVRPSEYLQQYGSLFGIEDPTTQLSRRRVWKDALGQTHTEYRQVHHGVLVFSGVIKVHQNAEGHVVAANGDFYPVSPGLELTATIAAGAAFGMARSESSQPVGELEHMELVIVDPGWYGDPRDGQHLAYHVVLGDRTSGLREALFIDAHSGALLDRWSMTCTARFRSIHDTDLGSDCCYPHDTAGCDEPACEPDVCEVDSSCCETEWNLICAARATGRCDDLCWPGALARAEDDPPTGVSDVDAAYDYYGDTYDYFFRAFGRDSIDTQGMAMVATVNSPVAYCPNAFWTGGTCHRWCSARGRSPTTFSATN